LKPPLPALQPNRLRRRTLPPGHPAWARAGSSHEIRLHRISLMQDFPIADTIIIRIGFRRPGFFPNQPKS
jgi:hypothetical protein